MPGLVILLKTKEILEGTSLAKVLPTVDRIVIAPGKEVVLESYNQSMMSEASMSAL